MLEGPYREATLRPTDPYRVASTKYRRRRLWMWVVFLSLPAVAWGFPSMVRKLTGASADAAFLLYTVPVSLTAFALVITLAGVGGAFACPRCGSRWGRRSNPLSSRCLACIIEIGAGMTAASVSPRDPP